LLNEEPAESFGQSPSRTITGGFSRLIEARQLRVPGARATLKRASRRHGVRGKTIWCSDCSGGFSRSQFHSKGRSAKYRTGCSTVLAGRAKTPTELSA
jgi:hypothetical protein